MKPLDKEQLQAVREAVSESAYFDGLPHGEMANDLIKRLTHHPVEFAEGEVYAVRPKSRGQSCAFTYQNTLPARRNRAYECRKLSTIESGAGELVEALESAKKRLFLGGFPVEVEKIKKVIDKWKSERCEK